jgi:hypothetical protein
MVKSKLEDGERAALRARYEAAAHAVQSAIKFLMYLGYKATDPKHMRVGIDMGKADHGALVRLLIEKGVFNEDEYLQAVAEGAEREAREMTQHARHFSGHDNIHFG